MLRAASFHLRMREAGDAEDVEDADDGPSTQALAPLTLFSRAVLAREVIATYAEARRRLRTNDLSATVAELRGHVPQEAWREPDAKTFWEGVRLAKATRATLRLLPTDTRCLMQSLVLLGLLSRRAIGSVLVVAAKADRGFEAHAWVEHDGRPLLPAGDYGKLVEL
jgi:hypothetical protein